MKKNIIVIGSGFGGLGAASRLLSAGHDVTILEKRDKLGGRAYVYEKNGFKFDGGPTVITAPFMFDDIFEAAGKKREDYFELVPCDPFYRIFDHEGKGFDYNSDHDFILSEIEKRSPEDVKGYEEFIKTTKPIFEKGFVELADKPFLKFTDMLKVAPDLIKLKSHQSVYKYVSQFIEDEFLRRAFSFHPLLVGGNPFDTTSIYSMIHYLEREWGVHYAMGGTGAIVNGLEKLIIEQGGKIHTETEVEEILVNDGKAVGVRLKTGEILEADEVVSNADVAFTYKNLINPKHRKKYTDRKIEKTKYSMSLFVIYFGTRKRYNDTNLAHHNIILGERYKGLLSDIFHDKKLSDDFSLYLHMPTKTDPSMAPKGHEAFYVLSPVPHLDGETDWNEMAPIYRDKIMNFLEENYLPDLQENLVAEHYIDPLHFQNELNSYKGSAFSVEPILTQSAWFRPHNKSEDVDSLYFVGAGTHPGAGLPGVLSSSIIAQDLIGKA
ncbi:phytoene desaturase [Gracilimonas sp. Q87]|uniref:phytoene desaturase n=1 Tax=Gracilimonas sp. Q87 TaxID=3384766 RepID=UPI003983FB8B